MGETRSGSSPRRIQVRPPSWVIQSSTVAGPFGPASSTAYWSLNLGLATSNVPPPPSRPGDWVECWWIGRGRFARRRSRASERTAAGCREEVRGRGIDDGGSRPGDSGRRRVAIPVRTAGRLARVGRAIEAGRVVRPDRADPDDCFRAGGRPLIHRREARAGRDLGLRSVGELADSREGRRRPGRSWPGRAGCAVPSGSSIMASAHVTRLVRDRRPYLERLGRAGIPLLAADQLRALDRHATPHARPLRPDIPRPATSDRGSHP